jgi:hypothetical protein
MSNPTTIPSGNVKGEWVLAATLSPSSVANATSAEQTFSVKGLLLGDHVSVNKPTAQAGLAIVGSRVSANDTLGITFGNFTSATITPTASQVYLVHVKRVDNLSSTNAPILTAIVS